MTIEHIAIATADIDRLSRFYSTYFGLEAEAEITGSTGARIIFMHSPEGGARIELMQKPQPITQSTALSGNQFVDQSDSRTVEQPSIAPDGYVHMAFSAGSEANVDALIQRLQAAGVSILRQPRHTPSGSYLATIADPDGNPLEIVP